MNFSERARQTFSPCLCPFVNGSEFEFSGMHHIALSLLRQLLFWFTIQRYCLALFLEAFYGKIPVLVDSIYYMTSTVVALSPWFCAVEISPFKIMFACTRAMRARI